MKVFISVISIIIVIVVGVYAYYEMINSNSPSPEQYKIVIDHKAFQEENYSKCYSIGGVASYNNAKDVRVNINGNKLKEYDRSLNQQRFSMLRDYADSLEKSLIVVKTGIEISPFDTYNEAVKIVQYMQRSYRRVIVDIDYKNKWDEKPVKAKDTLYRIMGAYNVEIKKIK